MLEAGLTLSRAIAGFAVSDGRGAASTEHRDAGAESVGVGQGERGELCACAGSHRRVVLHDTGSVRSAESMRRDACSLQSPWVAQRVMRAEAMLLVAW